MPDYMMDVSLYDARRPVGNGYIYDRPTDWEKARAFGITAAAIKSSEGAKVWKNGKLINGAAIDPAFLLQWAAAAGRPRVAWHFFRANINAIAQAHDFLSFLQSAEWSDTDRACIDWETTDGISPAQNLEAGGSFLYEVEKELKTPPFLYTYPYFWTQLDGEKAKWAAHYPLWIGVWPLDNWIANLKTPPYIFGGDRLRDLLAKVTDGRLTPLGSKPYYGVLAPWMDNITAWQFTARINSAEIPGHPGIKKVVDMSIVFKPWWSGEIQPPPPPEPQPWAESITAWARGMTPPYTGVGPD